MGDLKVSVNWPNIFITAKTLVVTSLIHNNSKGVYTLLSIFCKFSFYFRFNIYSGKPSMHAWMHQIYCWKYHYVKYVVPSFLIKKRLNVLLIIIGRVKIPEVSFYMHPVSLKSFPIFTLKSIRVIYILVGKDSV